MAKNEKPEIVNRIEARCLGLEETIADLKRHRERLLRIDDELASWPKMTKEQERKLPELEEVRLYGVRELWRILSAEANDLLTLCDIDAIRRED